MISPITWLWNIKHGKLIEETKTIMRLYFFLRNDYGLKEAYRLGARKLRKLL